MIHRIQTGRQGKLIVIEGADGAGKTTQARLLVDYLKRCDFPIRTYDFPRYYNSFYGRIIARYLRGELGNINEISPYLIALAFALDRSSVRKEMRQFLHNDGYVVTNRYATSSMVYQAAKFADKHDQDEFLRWNYDLEYRENSMPHENIVIYLHVPWHIGRDLTRKKEQRAYLNGKKEDIHEADIEYRKAVEVMYLRLAGTYKHWVKIDCVDKNNMLLPQDIHEAIITVLKKKGIL